MLLSHFVGNSAMRPSKDEMELRTASPLLKQRQFLVNRTPLLVDSKGSGIVSPGIVTAVPQHMYCSDGSSRSHSGDRSEEEDNSDDFVAHNFEQHHELLDVIVRQSNSSPFDPFQSDVTGDSHAEPIRRLSNLIRRLRRNVQVYGYQSIPVAETWNTIGLVQCRIYQNYSLAIQCNAAALLIFQSLLEEEKRLNPPTSEGVGELRLHLIVTYMDMGASYELLQNYPLALQSYRAAEALMEKGMPRHIEFSCRRSLARLQRL
jgi:hypothetical protein